MKKLLFVLCLLLSTVVSSQVLVAYDNIETWNWVGGWWTPALTTGYFNNAFVSSTSSAAIYGTNQSPTNIIEQDWYSMPNLVVSSTHSHTFRFRLGSYRITSTAAGSGVDAPDYVTVQLSTNGGVTYVNEMRITGFSNAYWNYNGAIAAKTSNGTLTTYAPTAGGNRTSTGDGYSIIELTIPPGVSNIAVDLYCRVNSVGEEWWIDNISLTQNTALPIELISFDGTKKQNYNLLEWVTASENNNDYFRLERSEDGIIWTNIGNIDGSGNSNTKMSYSFTDFTFPRKINYYRLSQVDYNGASETFDLISIDNSISRKTISKYYNLLGQEIDEFQTGIIILQYEDGTIEKVIK